MQQELPWGPWSSTVNGELILDMPFQFQLWASLSLITFPRGDWFTTMLSFFGHDEAKTFCMPRWTRRTRGFYMPAGSFLVTIRFILEIALYILQKKKKHFCWAIASEFVVNHSAFSFWTCDDPAHTYLKLCTLWDDQQQLRVMEVQNMVDSGPGHRRQVHGGSLQAFKDITSARLPRTKSYVHGEASWSASVLSSSLGSDFRP